MNKRIRIPKFELSLYEKSSNRLLRVITFENAFKANKELEFYNSTLNLYATLKAV